MRMAFPEASLVSEQGASASQEVWHFPRTSQPHSLRLCTRFPLEYPSLLQLKHCSPLIRECLVTCGGGPHRKTDGNTVTLTQLSRLPQNLCQSAGDHVQCIVMPWWALLIHLSPKGEKSPPAPWHIEQEPR